MKKLMVLWLVSLFCAATAFGADEQRPGMKRDGMKKEMMQEMMQNPHHKLAMTYKKNLINFANALKTDIRTTGKVDKNLAETAVKEMRHSLDQVRKHHDEAKSGMPEEMRTQRAEMIKTMENRMTVLSGHMDRLEQELKAESPDPKKVQAELDQILKQCEMMKMKKMGKKGARTSS